MIFATEDYIICGYVTSLYVFSWLKKIPMVCSSLEKAWLFHEIGWSYQELGRHEDAREYGVGSAAAADEIADEKWQINANVLVAQAECNFKFFFKIFQYLQKHIHIYP